MESLLAFRPRRTVTVELPLWATASDHFKHYPVTDDSLEWITIGPGSQIIGLLGAVWDGHPHIAKFGGRPYIGIVAFVNDQVRFISWHDGIYSGLYRREELDIESVVVSVLVASGPTWHVRPPDRAAYIPQSDYYLPLIDLPRVARK